MKNRDVIYGYINYKCYNSMHIRAYKQRVINQDRPVKSQASGEKKEAVGGLVGGLSHGQCQEIIAMLSAQL